MFPFFTKCFSASIEEAISAEKLFCDYFSTTEAEAVEIQPTKPNILKSKILKKKKAPMKIVERAESSSESDAECQG